MNITNEPHTRIGIALFDGTEELDWAGPWEVLSYWSHRNPEDGVEVFTVARITAHTGSRTEAGEGVGWGRSTGDGEDNTTSPEGRASAHRTLCEEGTGRRMAKANNAHDKTHELQRKLYQAAKRSPTRRFHALYDRIYRRDFLELGWNESGAIRVPRA